MLGNEKDIPWELHTLLEIIFNVMTNKAQKKKTLTVTKTGWQMPTGRKTSNLKRGKD